MLQMPAATIERSQRCPLDVTTATRARRHVGLIGTFPPRPCGLATFTSDVADSLRAAGDQVTVTALVDGPDDEATGATRRLVQTSEASARAIAAELSATVDVVLIEHEFGIFGGRGSRVLQALTDHLTVPFVITLHTVIQPFTQWQIESLAAPLADAASIFVFSDEAVELIAAQFPDVRSRCQVVPHAAPTEMFRGPRDDDGEARRRLGLPVHTKVVTTFGLLSPSKGIEHAIRAMPSVRERVGDVRYLVAGRTHPEVVRRRGERYRSTLQQLTRTLGVDDVVHFRDWFHDIDELSALLHATDVFVTPYGDADQIVSGALSFAIAAGVPFVSTPYRYATGLAGQGCGLTVPFGDDDALADALVRVLTDDDLRHAMATSASTVSAARSWPEVGRLMHGLLARVADDHRSADDHRTATVSRSVGVRVS